MINFSIQLSAELVAGLGIVIIAGYFITQLMKDPHK